MHLHRAQCIQVRVFLDCNTGEYVHIIQVNPGEYCNNFQKKLSYLCASRPRIGFSQHQINFQCNSRNLFRVTIKPELNCLEPDDENLLREIRK